MSGSFTIIEMLILDFDEDIYAFLSASLSFAACETCAFPVSGSGEVAIGSRAGRIPVV